MNKAELGNRRRERRHPVRVEAEVLVGPHVFTGLTQDISAGGALLEVQHGSRHAQNVVGQVGKLVIACGHDIVEIRCEARHMTEHLLGIRFLNVDFDTAIKLRKIVQLYGVR